LFYPLDSWGYEGNPDLKPEESTSWEFGFEKDFGDDSMFSLTYFQQEYENLISWENMKAENINKAEVKGVESTLEIGLGESVDMNITYTYLDTENKETGKPLIERPEHKGSLDLGYRGGSFGIGAIYMYVGERYDGDEMDPYDLLSLKGEYRFGRTFTIFARVENALNGGYEVRRNYGTPGRAYYAGAKAEF
jgi:vitamin B12 transporter